MMDKKNSPRCGEPTRRVVKYGTRNIDGIHLTHMRESARALRGGAPGGARARVK